MGALIVDKGYDGDGSRADVISRGDLGVKCPGAR
jgi:hypothetical protein